MIVRGESVPSGPTVIVDSELFWWVPGDPRIVVRLLVNLVPGIEAILHFV